jgi:glycosyltransferase involved in cell wall biosynthesis
LVDIVAHCQLFLSLARRTGGWEELFGMAVVEAMAAGVPCVASDHIGPRGIIHHGEDGFLCEEGDLRGVIGWIDLLMAQPDRWRQVSDAAVATAGRFRIEDVAWRWRNVLTKLPERSDERSPFDRHGSVQDRPLVPTR